jgi:hypothetical protein
MATSCRTCLTVLTGSNIAYMRRQFRALIISLMVVLSPPAVKSCLAQSATPSDRSQTGVVLTKLFEPVYPAIPRMAHITGEVDLMLGVGRDGSVESAVVVSGPPLLQKAAVDSAQKSQFECRECSENVTSYSLIYTFQLDDKGCCTATSDSSKDGPREARPQIIQSQNHVTLIDEPGCICDPPANVPKFRSVKCLYLWKCGVR